MTTTVHDEFGNMPRELWHTLVTASEAVFRKTNMDAETRARLSEARATRVYEQAMFVARTAIRLPLKVGAMYSTNFTALLTGSHKQYEPRITWRGMDVRI